jgi:hypothetical protein
MAERAAFRPLSQMRVIEGLGVKKSLPDGRLEVR